MKAQTTVYSFIHTLIHSFVHSCCLSESQYTAVVFKEGITVK